MDSINNAGTSDARDGYDAVRSERDELKQVVRELTHLQLIARDAEIGLRSQLMQAEIDLAHAHAVGAAEVAKVRQSTAWRVGRLVTRPAAVVKHRLRRR